MILSGGDDLGGVRWCQEFPGHSPPLFFGVYTVPVCFLFTEFAFEVEECTFGFFCVHVDILL